jgi:Ricin-type beta-trefoil lectin domain-like
MRTPIQDLANTPGHKTWAQPFRLISAAAAMLATAACCLAAAGPAAAAGPGHAAAPRHAAAAPHSPLASLPAPGVSTDSSFEVINYNSGKCLGTSGGHNDADAVQWTCQGAKAKNQQWHWGSQNSTYPGWYQLVNGNGDCLGISAGSTHQGADAVGWKCLGSSHTDQYWAPLDYSCSGYVPLENLKSGYVLGVAGNSKANGAHVVQWHYQDVCNNQFWYGA